MSGICGLFNLDDAPVADADLRAMTAMLEKRGPERTGCWRDGSACLGQTLLATTPELQIERQPFTHSQTGCVITADVRLDNRDELLSAIGLPERRDSIGDAEIILRAYLTWGENCLDWLLGDFAFAIWDPRHRKLFCARDHFGMRPFYYHYMPNKRFVFASDARAILVLPQVPYQISQGRIADFLVPELEWIDYTSTFFDEIYRLPPGHRATVTPAGIDVAEYWQPHPGPDLGPLSDEDYAQGFLEVFTRAVKARLRTPPGAVGSMLSGGMDSGSVVAVAKDILNAHGADSLPTFSAAQHRGVDCAESRAIHAAVSMPSISPNLIYPEALDASFDELISGNEEPFDGEFMFLKAIYIAAQEQGQRVVLDGAGGDVVLGEGSYIVRLLRQGQLRVALGEIFAQQKFWGGSALASSVLRHIRAAFLPESVKQRLRLMMSSSDHGDYLQGTLISPDFAKSIHIEERRERLREMFPREWQKDFSVERCNAIRPNMTGGRERYARIAAASGAEASDPFMDKRVVDFCTRLPGRVRLKNGWSKMILRELMSDRLPDEVRWCRGKPHLGWLFNATVTAQAESRGELDISGLQVVLKDYVSPEALASAWQDFRSGRNTEAIHSAHVLSKWLQEMAGRPVVPSRSFS
jgi:asparagine synthase (glutamine-hydrolysing)